ncbi:MAG: M48 family metalloprotease [Aestuariivirgaceae bacterium]
MPALAQSRGLPLIRDAEIEGLMRLYTRPIFKAAGINPGAVKVHLVNHSSINAFVAGGQRIFIHTGLLLDAKTPNEVIGVLAHEAAHIAGGHLARLGIQIDKLTTANIVGMLLAGAAVAGAAASGQPGAGRAGAGVLLGTQSLTQRSLLAYARVQESASDQAAVRFLDRTGQSSRGMLELFHKLANRSIGTLQYIDPYVQSHPLPLERIRNLERIAKASPHFNKKDPPALVLRHQLMQAKLIGFLKGPQQVYQAYPSSDKSLQSRYARAISAFRTGKLRNAIPLTDSLIRDMPKYPYFWELKGQALLEGGQPAKAIKPLRRAQKLLPHSGLIKIMLGQAHLNSGGKDNAKAAVSVLKRARRSENNQPRLHLLLAQAYGKLNRIALAELETAEAAMLMGDRQLARQKIKRALGGLKRGTPEWIRANDILKISGRKS